MRLRSSSVAGASFVFLTKKLNVSNNEYACRSSLGISLYWKHDGETSSIASRRSRRRLCSGGRKRRRHCRVAEERDTGCGHEYAPTYMHRQRSEYLDRLLDDRSWEDRLEDVS